MIRFAAATFEILPGSGASAGSTWEEKITEIHAALKSSLFLIADDSRLIALLTTHFITDYYCVSILLRQAISRALNISIDQVFCFSSHNHCSTRLNAKDRRPFVPIPPDDLHADEELTADGLELLRLSVETAIHLENKLEPVEIRYGAGKERRITYNRKGYRADSTTYLMREEDRLLLAEDFNGDIDDDAFVIGFYKDDNPLGFLTQFTGHPVTAYHCDHPIVCAEFPQVACDDLSRAYGNVPVGFLQGCAGETNSKGMLSGLPMEQNIRRTTNYGHQLGETFLAITKNLQRSEREDLAWKWRQVHLPYQSVPPLEELTSRLNNVEEFLRKCEAGDLHDTQTCDGLNFAKNMNLSSRANLVVPTQKWLKWAISFHSENRLHEAPAGLDLPVVVIRIGDVGIVGLTGEPLLGIGRQIKHLSQLPITVPCGYMNEGQDTWGYIPDGPNCEDYDYNSSFYRYTEVMLPFRKPAGDLLATTAVKMLEETWA